MVRTWAMVMACLSAAAADGQGVAPLRPGDPLPGIAAPTLAGSSLSLPTHDGPSVILFGFSRRAGDDSKQWGESVAKALPVYSVILLDAVPPLLRPMVTASIRRSMPEAARQRSVIVTAGEEAWRRRLGVEDVDRAYVLLLDRNGVVVWENNDAYRADAAKALVMKARSLH